LAKQLVAAGEVVLDIPAKLSARVRLLDTECADKSDSHDARSAAIAGAAGRTGSRAMKPGMRITVTHEDRSRRSPR
jgi:hypothetical protein